MKDSQTRHSQKNNPAYSSPLAEAVEYIERKREQYGEAYDPSSKYHLYAKVCDEAMKNPDACARFEWNTIEDRAPTTDELLRAGKLESNSAGPSVATGYKQDKRNPTLASDDDIDDDDDAFVPRAPPRYVFAVAARCTDPDLIEKGFLPEGWFCARAPHVNKGNSGALYYACEKSETTRWLDPRDAKRKSAIVEVFSTLHHFLGKMEKTPTEKWYTARGDKEEDAYSKWEFEQCFSIARKYVMAHCRWICATSACSVYKIVRKVWAMGRYGAPPTMGILVLKDEAAKDTEANFRAPIVNNEWHHKIHLVIACGDREQLKPVVFGNHGKTDSNQYLEQLQRPLFTRLIKNGYPHHELVEQSRMHEELTRFPNEHVYDNKLRSADCCRRSLEEDLPGIKTCAIHPLFVSVGVKEPWLTYADRDSYLRLHCFQVQDKVSTGPNKSKVNHAEVQFYVQKILARQIEYFKENTSKECLVITGYSETTKELAKAFTERKLPTSHQPSIKTIDSSQGTEASWVVMLAATGRVNGPPDLGFLKDKNRINVAFARARHIFYLVHGSMDPYAERLLLSFGFDEDRFPPPLLPKFVAEMKGSDRCKEIVGKYH
jgi:hypothetical protein